ncbi:hypothetical protein FRC02_009792 [Tulasnella sp. 418]|nr:hypothetical protein FRC02_009792 [Tulasnella sp. 418]
MTEILDSLNDFRTFSLKSYGLRGSHGYFPNLDDGREYVFPASVIRPLLKFTLLEDLNLDLSPPIDFVDEDIESIIKALPRLIRVAIGVTNNRTFQCWGTRLTPSCLSLFATFARKLRYLSISVGAQWLELINAGFSSTSTSKLSSLQLNHSQIFPHVQEVEKIVSTLRTLFPHLREVEFKFEADEGQDISSEENGARRWIQEAFRGRGG